MSRRGPKGFTLIELLVVIAIIALLVSILMPSLGKARALAQRAVCSVHLASCGKVVAMYANLYDGYMMPASICPPGGVGSASYWYSDNVMGAISATVNNAKAGMRGVSDEVLNMLTCPSRPRLISDEARLAQGADGSAFVKGTQWKYDYSYNRRLGFVSGDTNYLRKIDGIADPSIKLVMADLGSAWDYTGAYFNYMGDFTGVGTMTNAAIGVVVGLHHSDGFNVLMLDGHVEQRKSAFDPNIDLAQNLGAITTSQYLKS